MKTKAPEYSLNHQGYTLLEAMIGLTLLLTVLIPLMVKMHDINRLNRGNNAITASCLLEQEAALIQGFPDECLSSKRRVVLGKKWEIKATFTGNGLVQCLLTASLGKKEIERVVFMFYKKGD
jgi:hypothetical protein